MSNTTQDVHRAAKAREALENEVIADALSAWETEITEAWKSSPLRDVEGRERLRLMLEASSMFKAYMEATMTTGMLARVPTPQPTIWARARATLSGGKP